MIIGVLPTPTPTATPGAASAGGAALLGGLDAAVAAADEGAQLERAAVSSTPEPLGVAVFKDPGGANYFIGQGPLVFAEWVTDVPANEGLSSFELHVAYDSGVVAVQFEEGPFLSSTGRDTYCLRAASGGLARISCYSQGEEPAPAGSGVLAFLTVEPAASFHPRASAQNGVLVLLDDVSEAARLLDGAGAPITLEHVGDSNLLMRALEGDVNGDCAVNVLDQQAVAAHFGFEVGSLNYLPSLDLEPADNPDGDIDINDVQVIFGRAGSTCAAPEPDQPPPPSQPGPPCTDDDGDTLCNYVDDDDDGDGCLDVAELGTDPVTGGQRDPLSFWDFYDVWTGKPFIRDQNVAISDIGAIVARFGAAQQPPPTEKEALSEARTPPPPAPAYHPGYDRGGNVVGAPLWTLLPPNGSITIGDIGAAVAQFGHDCRPAL